MNNTKQSVSLIFCSPLWLISNAIRYSHNNHDKSDSKVLYRDNGTIETSLGSKDFNLIKRVGFHMNHSSVLEHSLIVFNLELTQKALLELSRHRIGLSMTVTSSRYALGSMGVEFEQTGSEILDRMLDGYKKQLEKLVSIATKKEFDKLAELLPQAFIYKGQFTFNLRSLVHFLKLRTSKSAHKDIRILAYQMFNVLPEEYKELIFCDKQIAKQIKDNKND